MVFPKISLITGKLVKMDACLNKAYIEFPISRCLGPKLYWIVYPMTNKLDKQLWDEIGLDISLNSLRNILPNWEINFLVVEVVNLDKHFQLTFLMSYPIQKIKIS